jgi:DNA polymerase III subunit gamma/tau
MSYQVIARKYRPQRFSDVVGQEHVTQTLAHAVEQNRIAHAYLFCGPRGTGKTTVARIFAKCLNCTDGPRVDFPDDDPRCVEITEGRSLDVLEIDGASNNGVEQVRELRESARFAPAACRFKIYIIDEVHMLSTSAFNALLKTLEEPPAHVKFMFATTDPEKVLPTILSRCQRFDLRRIPVRLIVSHLSAIARHEGVEIDDAALHAIARGADGGMRDAESALDQLISFCGAKIVEADVLTMFGLTAQAQILSLSEALLRGDPAAALTEFDHLCQHGKDLGRLLADLLAHYRNVLVYQVAGGDLRLLEASEAEAASLAAQSAQVGTEPLSRMLEVLTQAESHYRSAASRRIFVEVALIKTIEARQAVSLDALLKQLALLRQNASSTPAVPPAVQPAAFLTQNAPVSRPPARKEPPAPLTLQEEPGTPPAPGGAPALDQLWRDLVEAVGRASPFARSYLLEAFPVSLVNKVLTIGFDPEFADHIGLVDNLKNHTLIATKLQELGQPGTQVKFIVAEAPTQAVPPPEQTPAPSPAAAAARSSTQTPGRPAAPTTGQALDPKEFKNDPLIKKALEVFKGQIVEVRA